MSFVLGAGSDSLPRYLVQQTPRTSVVPPPNVRATLPSSIHSAASPKNLRSTIATSPRRCSHMSTPTNSFNLSTYASLGAGCSSPSLPTFINGMRRPSAPSPSPAVPDGMRGPSVRWQRSASPPASESKIAARIPPPKQQTESATKPAIKEPLRAAVAVTDSTPTSNRQVESIAKTLPRRSVENRSASLLHTLGRDLTTLAERGELDPLVGRTAQIEQMIQALARRRKNNPVLVGDPGVGKTAVVEGLAQQIVKGDVPDVLQDKSIVELDVAGLLAGTKNRGDFEERMKKIMEEVLDSRGQIILFIDEIHTIVGAGGSAKDGSALDAASLLKPILARGDIQCIGATTLAEYRSHIEKDSSLERRFQPIKVHETSCSETLQILRGLAKNYESHHKVQYSEEAILACVKLAADHISERFMPDKAIDVLDEVGAFVHLRHQASKKRAAEPHLLRQARKELQKTQSDKYAAVKSENYDVAARSKLLESQLQKKIQLIVSKMQNQTEETEESDSLPGVTANDVAQVVSRITGVPLEKLSDSESAQILNLEMALHRRIIGQDQAVAAVSKALRRARVGLKSPSRPIASFLFCGPTGVGKTELCKVLSEIYFGKGDAMIRIDMSEFMEKHSVAKLIGSPAGYIGYGDENQLTDRIRRNPYSLVLFDEVEKAHPDVLNLMLQMMEDGCLTDASGRSVTFRNNLIVLTSNVGGRASELGKAFSPEFLNRLDEVIPFAPLCRNDVASIAELELAKTIALVREKGVTVTLGQAFKDEVVKQGYDATYGARPLRRAVVKLLDDELANFFLNQSFAKGDCIHVDFNNDLRVVVTSVSDEVEDSESSADSSREALSSEAEDKPAMVLQRALHKQSLQSSDIDTESTAGSDLSLKVSSSEADAPMFPPPLSELL